MSDEDWAMPDVWYERNDGSKMTYWYQDGRWIWRHLSEDDELIAEGEGAP